MASPDAPTVRRQWLIAVSVTCGTMMGALDAAIVNVALPHIRATYGVTVEQATWLSVAFIIAAVLVMPLTGFLGRLYGQKNVYLACLALFTVASALCAIAPTFTWLVVLRALQGLGAGALQPTEHAILRQTFPPHRLGAAMGMFNLAVGIGPLTGPTLGGWIVDHVHWSWIFLVNLPVGIAGSALVIRFVPADEPRAAEPRGRLDWPGIAVLWTALLALQYVLEEGQHRAWFESPLIVALTVIAVAGSIAFVRRELAAASPAVDLRVFRHAAYTVGSLTNAIAMAIILSSAFLLPVFLQELLGYTAMSSGLVQLPRTVVMIIAMPIIGRLYHRIPPRSAVFLGLALTALGQFLLAGMTLHSDAADATVALVLQGIGMSLVIITLSTLSLAAVPRPELGDAAGLAALLRQVATSTGLAVMATVLARSSPVDAARAADAALATEAVRQARLLGFQHTFAVGGILYLCLLPAVWFLRAQKRDDDRGEITTKVLR